MSADSLTNLVQAMIKRHQEWVDALSQHYSEQWVPVTEALRKRIEAWENTRSDTNWPFYEQWIPVSDSLTRWEAERETEIAEVKAATDKKIANWEQGAAGAADNHPIDIPALTEMFREKVCVPLTQLYTEWETAVESLDTLLSEVREASVAREPQRYVPLRSGLLEQLSSAVERTQKTVKAIQQV